MNTNKEDIILSYLVGTMSPEETLAFEQKLETDIELAKLFSEYDSSWKLTNQLKYDQRAVNDSWDTFKQQITQPKKVIGFDWLKVAASVVLLAAFTYGMWFFGSTDISLITKQTITEQSLSDGSVILLNANSRLTAKDFDRKSRAVSLVGQAHFNIQKAKNKFEVKTSTGTIEVYGTQFDVYTNEQTQFTMVELYEGSVGYLANGKKYMLLPGQRLTSESGVVSIRDFEKPVSWNEHISCQDVPLSYIFGQLKLTYNVGFDVSEKLLKVHYTLTLPKNDLAACVHLINQVSGHNFALIENTIVVK
jgi:transmembrane sensor